MKEPLVCRMLRYSLYAVLFLGVVLTVTLPFLLDSYIALFYDAYQIDPGYRAFILAFLVAVAVPGLWIVLEMIRMMRSIPQEPFVIRNVSALNRIGVIFIVLAAAFLGKCLMYVTFLTLLGGILFIVGSLFAFTLANLFRQAVVFKEENDLTI